VGYGYLVYRRHLQRERISRLDREVLEVRALVSQEDFSRRWRDFRERQAKYERVDQVMLQRSIHRIADAHRINIEPTSMKDASSSRLHGGWAEVATEFRIPRVAMTELVRFLELVQKEFPSCKIRELHLVPDPASLDDPTIWDVKKVVVSILQEA
jgi:hypothetical protein